jgi:hypothetical protein
MSDLLAPKQMDGYRARFLRFAGPDHFVIEVNGSERTLTQEMWRTLPDLQQQASSKNLTE